jgi:hypothetical protein
MFSAGSFPVYFFLAPDFAIYYLFLAISQRRAGIDVYFSIKKQFYNLKIILRY